MIISSGIRRLAQIKLTSFLSHFPNINLRHSLWEYTWKSYFVTTDTNSNQSFASQQYSFYYRVYLKTKCLIRLQLCAKEFNFELVNEVKISVQWLRNCIVGLLLMIQSIQCQFFIHISTSLEVSLLFLSTPLEIFFSYFFLCNLSPYVSLWKMDSDVCSTWIICCIVWNCVLCTALLCSSVQLKCTPKVLNLDAHGLIVFFKFSDDVLPQRQSFFEA